MAQTQRMYNVLDPDARHAVYEEGHLTTEQIQFFERLHRFMWADVIVPADGNGPAYLHPRSPDLAFTPAPVEPVREPRAQDELP